MKIKKRIYNLLLIKNTMSSLPLPLITSYADLLIKSEKRRIYENVMFSIVRNWMGVSESYFLTREIAIEYLNNHIDKFDGCFYIVYDCNERIQYEELKDLNNEEFEKNVINPSIEKSIEELKEIARNTNTSIITATQAIPVKQTWEQWEANWRQPTQPYIPLYVTPPPVDPIGRMVNNQNIPQNNL